METESKKEHLVFNILNEKCPNCRKGYVFKKEASLWSLPVMYDKCEACHYQYEREPGYFLGAMYISYGLAVLQGLITFLIVSYSFPLLSLPFKTLTVIFAIILFGKKNYKLSRVLYIHIFPW